MIKPYAYLVGAGPGDEDLITVKGREAIKKADVILYDRLANPGLLNHKKEGALCIDVGKSPHHHPYRQEEINVLIVQKAKEGNVVTRLKGGDPYVFGRGGEEAMALYEAGIPFEVIPGITSAIGACNYGGIPVTHRNCSTSFHVITGHEDPTKEKRTVNYEALAMLEGTLVFLMGVGNLHEITTQLMKYGKSVTTPIALIHRGTTARQKTLVGTLETIVNLAAKEGIKSPSIIVVGDVVKLREKLNWFEKMPLQGKRIMVTRTRQQASQLSNQLRSLGAEVVEFPTIEIKLNHDPEAVEEKIKNVNSAQYLIFTSVNGVKCFFQKLRDLTMDIRSIGSCKIVAIGNATAEALEDKGLLVELIPEEFTAEGIIEGLRGKIVAGDRVFLPRAEIARKNLVIELEKMGAVVEEIPIYLTTIPTASREELITHFKEGIDIITFTSSSTVNNFVEILGYENIEIIKQAKIGAIGPITAKTIEDLKLNVDFQGKEYTINGLIKELVKGAF